MKAELFFFAGLALILGFCLDLTIGDPRGWPHLVRWYGFLIKQLEGWLYPKANKRLSGLLLVLMMLGISLLLPALVLFAAWRLSPWAYLLTESLLCWQCLSLKSLKDESLPVYKALAKNDLPAARQALSMIVGRDTAQLDREGVIRAAVETVAENAADGVAAPLFYLALGGAPLACLYKAINTMDSMIAYKNERYADFGRAAARLDDVANYLPARLCALMMVACARARGFSSSRAFQVWRRDRRNHASPNSAQTEAAMAGALGVQLAGDAVYGGRKVRKPTIGDALRPIEAQDILLSHRLLYLTSFSMFLLALIIRGILYAAL